MSCYGIPFQELVNGETRDLRLTVKNIFRSHSVGRNTQWQMEEIVVDLEGW